VTSKKTDGQWIHEEYSEENCASMEIIREGIKIGKLKKCAIKT
jgi:hypothetical protein